MPRLLQCLFLYFFSSKYTPLAAARKTRLFKDLRGKMLEIGAGTGANFEFIPPGVRWVGVDPNSHSLGYIRKAAQRSGHDFDFHPASAECLPFADGSFDSVASTLTLCSVQDPALVLAEIRRVLRPGGQFLFMEHVAAPQGSRLRKRQSLLRPIFRCLAGCTPDRDTGALIRAAGFSSLELEEFVLSLPIVGPHICGRAVR